MEERRDADQRGNGLRIGEEVVPDRADGDQPLGPEIDHVVVDLEDVPRRASGGGKGGLHVGEGLLDLGGKVSFSNHRAALVEGDLARTRATSNRPSSRETMRS